MTMADDGRSRLGRGLAALMGDVSAEATTTTPERARTQRRVPIEYLRPNPRNPRRNFPDAELDELAASIKERGIIQPVVVRLVRGAKDAYEIIAKIVGKSRSHVTNTLRLLKLPEPVKAYIHAGKITAGAARMLIGAPDPEEMAREIVDRGLNVRQVEALAKDRAPGSGKAVKKRAMKNADTIALERRGSHTPGPTLPGDHPTQSRPVHNPFRSLHQLPEVPRRFDKK